ncbi:hypothetical protein RFI_14688 [Reticulomyxa filosa]|uniref:Uncharacterized protein n=1 Tax=Reticulomyxa filosa TaxID=46433 RepID=X6N8Z6_RETFI|nr:hypothetical protein RFI_14688 [Reticulomyxa filosa]|eukprot:ETO22511.1 hypothetical protein RFI_14688 [Reticulomyxa filosa]
MNTSIWHNKTHLKTVVEWLAYEVERTRIIKVGRKLTANRWFSGLTNIVTEYLFLPVEWKQDEHGGTATFLDKATASLKSLHGRFAILCADYIIDLNAKYVDNIAWEIEIVDHEYDNFYSNFGFVLVDPNTNKPQIRNWNWFINQNAGFVFFIFIHLFISKK